MRIETRKTISRNLKFLRTKQAMSQTQFASDFGLTKQLYASYELGNTVPDAEVLYLIARKYRLKVENFFTDNFEDFLTILSGDDCYDSNLNALIESYDQLSNFSKGMLLERASQLLYQDTLIKSKRAALNAMKPTRTNAKQTKAD